MPIDRVSIPSESDLRRGEQDRLDSVGRDYWLEVAERLHREMGYMFDALKRGETVVLVDHQGNSVCVERSKEQYADGVFKKGPGSDG